MPYRRFFIKTKHNHGINTITTESKARHQDLLEHHNRQVHIHVIPKQSIHGLRHIAFKNYLIEHAAVKNEYQKLKEELSLRSWKDGNDYKAAKDDFIKYHEAQAVKMVYPFLRNFGYLYLKRQACLKKI